MSKYQTVDTTIPLDPVAIKELADSLNANVIRRMCAAHIERHYPTYKQLNILRSGDPVEVAKMGAFIDACRAWSNGENPDPAALEAIQP